MTLSTPDTFVAPPPPESSDTPFYVAFGVLGGSYVVLIVTLLLADALYAFTTESQVAERIDFEAADARTPLSPGELKPEHLVRYGVDVSTEETCQPVLIGTKSPSPFQPPTGQSLGNVLAIASRDAPTEPLAVPHQLVFTWDDPVQVDEVRVLDANEPGGRITAFDSEGKSLGEFPIGVTLPNVLQTVSVSKPNVKRLVVRLGGRAAIAELSLTWRGRVRSEWERNWPTASRLVHNQIIAALAKPEIRYSIKLSLLSCTVTTILSLWVAVPIGYLMSRHEFRGRNLIDAILDIPIVLPPLVVGLSLLILFQYFPRGVREYVVYQVPAVILAQFSVACAFAVRTMRATFDQIDARREQVALTLGCSRMQAFSLVVFPEAKRGMLTAATLAWARSLGEFGPLLVFAGSTRGKTEVLSTTVYLELSIGNLGAAVAVSLIMVVAAVIVLVLARVWGTRTMSL